MLTSLFQRTFTMDKPCSNDFDGDGDEASRNEIEISLPESQLTLAIQLSDLQRPSTHQDSQVESTGMERTVR